MFIVTSGDGVIVTSEYNANSYDDDQLVDTSEASDDDSSEGGVSRLNNK